jgi:hypothetical protein
MAMMTQKNARRLVVIISAMVSALWMIGFIVTGHDPAKAVASGLIWFIFGMMAREVT